MPSWSDRLAPRPPLLALGFAAGIATAYALGAMIALGAAALAVLVGQVATDSKWRAPRRHLAVLLAALASGALVQGLRGRVDLVEQDAGAARTVTLRGVITRPSTLRFGDRYELRMQIESGGGGSAEAAANTGEDDRDETLEGRTVRVMEGRTVRVLARRAALAGDEVEVTGRLRPPRGTSNPGSPDRAAAARAEGIEAELSAESLEIVGRSGSVWLSMWRAAGGLRDRWTLAIRGERADARGAGEEQRDEARATSGDEASGDARKGANDDAASSRSSDGTSAPDDDARAARAALAGVVLGVRADIPPELDERWRAVGIYHVLSVSGLHLAVVALLLFTALRRLAAAAGTRIDPARLALLPALAAALGYTLLTGAQVATLRALLVAGLWMLARALGRPLRLVDALGVAALALLAWSPAQLWQPSFQLSFAAALALARHPAAPVEEPAAAAPRFTESRLGRLALRLLGHLARGATTSAWVALVTAPITAYHFHQVQPAGVVGNLVLTPLVELCALPLGLAGLVLGELWPAGGAALLDAAAFAVRVADALAALLHPICPTGVVAIASPLVAAALWAVTTALCGRHRRGLLDALAWAALCALWLAAPLSPPAGARVVFFDVGQGDAALIETASELWLVDAGGAPGAATAEAAAAPGLAVVRYLELSRRRRIDVVVLSHPHPDHYLGLGALAGKVAIGELWLPTGFLDEDPRDWHRAAPHGSAAPSFHDLVERLRRAGTLVREPPPQGRRSREGAALTVIAPRYREHAGGPARLAADPVRTVNDNSAVALLEYAGRRVLFAGDLELEGEEALIEASSDASLDNERPAGLPDASGDDLRVDLVKVPHHGSRTSSTPRFVQATSPRLAIISCGAANRFGFPAPEVVARWREAGAEVLRTDRGGAIIVELASDGSFAVRRR